MCKKKHLLYVDQSRVERFELSGRLRPADQEEKGVFTLNSCCVGWALEN